MTTSNKIRANFGISDDYAVVRFAGCCFYYGYEETVPEHVDEEDEDDESIEWAFVATVNGEEIIRLPTSAFDLHPAEDPVYFLLAGIAYLMSEGLLNRE